MPGPPGANQEVLQEWRKAAPSGDGHPATGSGNPAGADRSPNGGSRWTDPYRIPFRRPQVRIPPRAPVVPGAACGHRPADRRRV